MTDNKLTPLTPEQQKDFARSRINPTIVQNQCPKCGAWYETARLSQKFRETFLCDCGHRMEFDVPALEIIRAPTNTEKIVHADGDDRLDTGMKVSEAMRRAEHWWTHKGSAMMRQHNLRQQKDIALGGLGGQFASLDPDSKNFLPSRILAGTPWDALTKSEKHRVIKVWHHFHVRSPDLLGDDMSTDRKLQDLKDVN